MGRRSKIDQAGADFRVAVERANACGLTVDEIHQILADKGLKIARSTVGEYVKGTREAAEEMRRVTAAAEAMKLDLGDMQRAPMGQLLIQSVLALMTRTIMPLVGEQDEDKLPNFKEAYQISRAVKALADAQKVDFDMERKIREEVRVEERAAAAAAATSVVKDLMKDAGTSIEFENIISKAMGIPIEKQP